MNALDPRHPATTTPVLQVEDLRTHFLTSRGRIRAVDGLSFAVGRSETLCIVGESGCGKSVAALSIMRLLPEPPAEIVGGAVRLGGEDLLKVPEKRMQEIRGKVVSMIFQEPMTSLNPVLPVGRQIGEVIERHSRLSRRAVEARALEMLELVHIPEPRRRLAQYPHNLSGGMRQRVMIAIALACDPQVLIADEPTTALDVTIQAQILELMEELQDRLGTSIILITHDLGVVAEIARRVIVMYAGRKVEEAPVEQLFETPVHPYTRGLMAALPRLHRNGSGAVPRLAEIPGVVPAMKGPPAGCTFAPRCPFATELCRNQYPPLEDKGGGHLAACWEPWRGGGA